MADTNFIDRSTSIRADWLNDVNTLTYRTALPRITTNTTRNQKFLQDAAGTNILRERHYTVGRQGSGCDIICDGTNDQVEINNALVWIYSNGGGFTGGTLEYSDEIFNLSDSITIYPFINQLGQGMRATQFVTSAGMVNPAFALRVGADQQFQIGKFRIVGGVNNAPTNPGAWAMNLIAQPLAAIGNIGGLWDARFHHIAIDGFDNGIRLQGSPTGFTNTPNQFTQFDHVNVELEGTTGNAFLSTGQTGQITIEHSRMERRDSTLRGGTNIRLEAGSGDVSLRDVTMQNAEKGLHVIDAAGITIDDCWNENLYRAITIETTAGAGSTGNTITNTRFANAGSDGASGGYCIGLVGAAGVAEGGNFVLGNYDRYIDAGVTNTVRQCNSLGGTNFRSTALVEVTRGVTRQFASAATVDIGHSRTMGLSVSGTTISNITSTLPAGERIIFYMIGGSQVFNNSGNIDLSGVGSSITVASGGLVEFVITDLGARRFRLISKTA